ncbi:MAG: SGNH/GDSL hydrolase family protein [Solobacterium sp.]|nr:SGNH/GDSL hydrolase family protein [Solobacterium sp.]
MTCSSNKVLLAAACLLVCGCAAKEEEKEVEASVSQQAEYACRIIDSYDYHQSVPQDRKADSEYLSDSFFGGDSRMGALVLNGELKNSGAEIYYVTSLNIFRIDSMQVDNNEEEKTLYDLLMETDKHHIYLMLGINEIRYNTFDTLIEQYQWIIDEIRNAHPDVHIYIMLDYHPRSVSGLTLEELNAKVDDVNSKMIDLAVRNKCYFLDIDEALCDETGIIREDYVFDGLHLNVNGEAALEEYLLSHKVSEEDYVKEFCE